MRCGERVQNEFDFPTDPDVFCCDSRATKKDDITGRLEW